MRGKINIGVIGVGNMGRVIEEALVSEGSYRVYVCDRDKHKLKGLRRAVTVESLSELPAKVKILILAVKPCDVAGFMLKHRQYFRENSPLLISIAAGVTAAFFERRVKGIRVVRVMPNLAVQVKEAVSFIASGKFAKKNDLKITARIFSRVGEVIQASERDLNKATALSGSGPGYLFYLMDIFGRKAQKMGFAKETAAKMVIQTFRGAVKLAESGSGFAVLVRKVASQKGTTEAALQTFKAGKLEKIIFDGVDAACKRASEISKELK